MTTIKEIVMKCKQRWFAPLVIFLCLFVNSCCFTQLGFNNPEGVPKGQMGHAIIFISSEFSPNDKVVIKQGIDLWVVASRGLYSVDYVQITWDNIKKYKGVMLASKRCQDVIFFELALSTSKKITVLTKRDGVTTLGVGRHENCGLSRVGIVVDKIHSDRILKIVAAHEFGHAIGLVHSLKRNSIMYKTIGELTSKCLLKDDIDLFCDKFFCDSKTLSYCKYDVNNCDWKMPKMVH